MNATLPPSTLGGTAVSGNRSAIVAEGPEKARKHRFTLPGFFTLSDGRLVWIEKEFDLTPEFDAADAEYEAYRAKFQAGDHSYPGAYTDPDHLAKLETRAAFERQRDGIKEVYRKRMSDLGWGLEQAEARRAVEAEEAQILADFDKNAPPKVGYQRVRAPVHRFANRIFRIDLDERIIEFRMSNEARGRALISDVGPLSTAGKLALLERHTFALKDQLDDAVLRLVTQHWRRSVVEHGSLGRYGYNPTQADWDGWALKHTRDGAKAALELAAQWWESHTMPQWLVDAPDNTAYTGDEITKLSTWNTRSTTQIPHALFEAYGGKKKYYDPTTAGELKELYRQAAAARQARTDAVVALDAVFPELLRTGKILIDTGAKMMDIRTNSAFRGGSWSEICLPIWVQGRIGPLREQAQKKIAKAASFFEGGETHKESKGKGYKALDAVVYDPSRKKDDEEKEDDDERSAKREGSEHILARFALAEGANVETLRTAVEVKKTAFHAADPASMPAVPHLQATIQLMPHQAATGAKMNVVDRGLIDVDMGGGKASMFFSKAMLALQQGKCKRPLIVMPTNTVKQQVDEILHKFGDGINIIGITSHSFRKYGKGQEAYDRLAAQIRNAPPNTLVFVGFEWLSGQPRKVHSGRMNKQTGQPMKPLTDYWRSRYLTDECGIDMVILDECHKIKTPETAKARAVFGLSAVDQRLAGSGTMFPNTPDDVVGPMQFVDPSIFGSKEDFARKFELQMTRGKVIYFPPATLKKVRAQLNDYGMVSMRRTAWMHLMPKRTEKFHAVRLNPTIQKLYEDLMKGVIDQITGDPKLAAAWTRFAEDTGADDVDIDAEAPMLLTMLGRLEQFVTAPDSEIGGKLEDLFEDAQSDSEEDRAAAMEALEKLSSVLIRIRGAVSQLPPEMVISPKCRKAAEILDAHFANPDAGKAIIFVSHVGSMEHFMRYLPTLCHSVQPDQFVGYKADAKGRNALEGFKKDPDKKVLIAVDWSLREGHNLQMANCLIRASNHYSPGDQEQTYGRVYRPGATREITIHVLVTEKTLEVAKLGRLLSKYDSMRRVNSDYEGGGSEDKLLEPIRMNEGNLEEYQLLSQLGDYTGRYHQQAAHDMVEAERMATILGKEMYPRSGPPLPGARKIAGRLPYYEEADIYKPLNVKVYRGPKGDKVVIDDSESLECLTKGDASKLKLTYRDDGATGMWYRPAPSDMNEWLARAQAMSFTTSVTYSDGIPAAITPQSIEIANRPDLVKPTPTAKNTPQWEMITTVTVSGKAYAVYRQPSEKPDGTPTFKHMLIHHADGVVGNPAAGGETLATFMLSTKDGPEKGGLSEKARVMLDGKVQAHAGGDFPVAWEVPVRKVAPPRPPREPKPAPVVAPDPELENLPLTPPARVLMPADNIIHTLRLLNYDGIWYITVDSDDDDAPALRALGLVWFNAFYQREFESMQDSRRVLNALEAQGLTLDNIEEFQDHARDAIWARKVPQRKLLREQLVLMKSRRRGLADGKVDVHYVQFSGRHHVAVNALESQRDIGRVIKAGQFNRINASYWKPCPDREVLKKFVGDLHQNGYKVAYWKDFANTATKWFSYQPEHDLSVPPETQAKIPEPVATPAIVFPEPKGPAAKPPAAVTPVVAPPVPTTAPPVVTPAPTPVVTPAPVPTPTAVPPVGKKPDTVLTPQKVAVLTAVYNQNKQKVGGVLNYGGGGGFNIAVVQVLIDKGYMVAERNALHKQYEKCWLTEKGAAAASVPFLGIPGDAPAAVVPPLANIPAITPSAAVPAQPVIITDLNAPYRLHDVAKHLNQPADVLRKMVDEGKITKHKVPGVKKQWAVGVIPAEVQRALEHSVEVGIQPEVAPVPLDPIVVPEAPVRPAPRPAPVVDPVPLPAPTPVDTEEELFRQLALKRGLDPSTLKPAPTVEVDLTAAAEAATGPGWMMRANEIADDFDPKVRWVKTDNTQQILAEQTDTGWVVKHLIKGPAGIDRNTIKVAGAAAAIAEAKQLMTEIAALQSDWAE